MTTRVLLIVLLVAVLGALLWNAGEEHYQSCVKAAQATAAKRAERAALPAGVSPGFAEQFGEPRSVAKRAADLNGCSRWPF